MNFALFDCCFGLLYKTLLRFVLVFFYWTILNFWCCVDWLNLLLLNRRKCLVLFYFITDIDWFWGFFLLLLLIFFIELKYFLVLITWFDEKADSVCFGCVGWVGWVRKSLTLTACFLLLNLYGFFLGFNCLIWWKGRFCFCFAVSIQLLVWWCDGVMINPKVYIESLKLLIKQ